MITIHSRLEKGQGAHSRLKKEHWSSYSKGQIDRSKRAHNKHEGNLFYKYVSVIFFFLLEKVFFEEGKECFY